MDNQTSQFGIDDLLQMMGQHEAGTGASKLGLPQTGWPENTGPSKSMTGMFSGPTMGPGPAYPQQRRQQGGFQALPQQMDPGMIKKLFDLISGHQSMHPQMPPMSAY